MECTDAGTMQEAETGSGSLSLELRRMVNNPAFSDMAFITQDGERVWASRFHMAVRSPVLCAMLNNVEATPFDIPLPSISTAVLLPVLEFLYTDTLCLYPLSRTNAPDLVDAASYFLLSHFETFIAASYLAELDTLIHRDIVPHVAAVYLSEALALQARMKQPHMTYSDSRPLQKLVTAIAAAPATHQLSVVRSLSKEALAFFLDATRCNSQTVVETEYNIRLRYVLMWCASSMESTDAAQVLDEYLPCDSMCLDIKDKLLEKFSSIQDRICLAPWLPQLSLSRVHPANIVEPLGIIAPLHAFESNALLYSKCIDNRLHWKTGKDLSAVDESAVDDGVHEWDFVVEELSSGICLGFCSEEAFSSADFLSYAQDCPWLVYLSADEYRFGNGDGACGHD